MAHNLIKHCCALMNRCVESKKIAIAYDSALRRYYIHLSWPCKIVYKLFHCPWCGVKLPDDLTDEWFATLEEDYDIEDPWGYSYPQEFHTDEWWKKRRL